MALMTDTDIREILCDTPEWSKPDTRLHLSPFCEKCLTPVGYDLRVGNYYVTSSNPAKNELGEGQKFSILPGEVALVATLEQIEMPKNKMYSALIESKVSLVAEGLSHLSTTVDPDWSGQLLIPLHNPTNVPITLEMGKPFCTAVFFKNQSPATKPCGKESGRLDILLKNWERRFRQVNKRRRGRMFLTVFIPSAIIALSVFIALVYLPDKLASPAIVAAGVGVAGILQQILLPRR